MIFDTIDWTFNHMMEIQMKIKERSDIFDIRRAQLTSATYNVVSKKGYYNFTIKDIAQEAGMSTGLIHYYFKINRTCC